MACLIRISRFHVGQPAREPLKNASISSVLNFIFLVIMASGFNDSVALHVEVCQKSESSLPASVIENELEKYFKEQNEILPNALLLDTVLPSHVKYVRISSSRDDRTKVHLSEKLQKHYHIYQTWEDGPQVDSLSEENEEVPASLNWCLPNSAFEGLWESLILENGLKEQLMSYVQTTLLYSSRKVNAQIVHWNGVVLLHGPPGTGKTSLCKALAQKLSIRLNSKYKTSQLIEINTHSLFSKWFSESAKLVLKMFTSVKQWLQSDDHFVCILIDEVESLTHVRQSNGIEPSDSIRVVNAVLTQIDQLQRYPNFLILATSNVTETIDIAFADRADLKLFIPYPSKWGIYEILKSCMEELIACDLIKGNKSDFFDAAIFKHMCSGMQDDCNGIINVIMENSKILLDVSGLSEGLSGRTLRKIPFLTSTKFVNCQVPSIREFLEVMKTVVVRHKTESDQFFSTESSKKENKESKKVHQYGV